MLLYTAQLTASPQLIPHMHVALHLIFNGVEDSLVGQLWYITDAKGAIGPGVAGVPVSGVAIKGLRAFLCKCVGGGAGTEEC